jgi:uncharacterized protein
MLYGGEPLLNWEAVLALIQHARKLEAQNAFHGPLEIVLETNATLLNPSHAAALRDHGVESIVSIDGIREVHDSWRPRFNGAGSYDDAVKGFQILQEAGATAVISSVFTPDFADHAGDCVQHLGKDLGARSIGLNLYHLLDHAQIPEDRTLELFDRYIEAFEHAREVGIHIEHIMRRIRPLVERKIRFKDCTACGGRVVSDPAGRFGICEAFVGDDAYFRSRNSLTELRYDPVFVDWAARTPLTMEACRGCKAMGICGGGCVSNSIQQHGRVHAPDDYICESSKRIVDWALASWFQIAGVSAKLHSHRFHVLEPEERSALLGSLPSAEGLPLQGMSKRYEVGEAIRKRNAAHD